MANVIKIILFLCFTINLIVGILVLMRGRFQRVNQFFCLLMISASLWSIIFLFAIIFSSNILDKICVIFGLFAQVFFIFFSKTFSEPNKKFGLKFILITLIPAIFIGYFILSSNLITGPTTFLPNGMVEVADGPFAFLFYIYHIIYPIFGFYFLYRGYKVSIGIKRVQFHYLFIGLGLLLFIFILTNLIMPLFGFYYFISLSSSLFFILALFFLYIISRYRFLDIKIVIKKSFIYLISLIIILALYTCLALLLKNTIDKYWNVKPGWTAFVLLASVALGFPPLKNLVERSINTLFKGKKSIDLAVKEVREKMAVKTDTDSLIDLIVQEIRKYLELKEVKLFLIDHQKQKFIYNSEETRQEIELDSEFVRYFDKYPDILVREEIQHLAEIRDGRFDKEILQKVEKQMKKEKAGLIIPFKTEEEVFCLILISDRQDNQAYTVQDIEFLEKLREQVSFTLANALLYKEALARIQAEAVSKHY